MACAAEWLHRPFLFSTFSLDIPYQILEDIQKSGRRLALAFSNFFKSAGKRQDYLQRVHILAENGTMPVLRHLRKFEAHSLLQIFGGNIMVKHTLSIFFQKNFFKVEISPQVCLLRSPSESAGRGVRT